ncbi:MAG TPA: hypothetical protein VED63_10120 [Acidimicrobiales bacterium]|nr:hypothetical protein [Acidimicrobiales bacterium]
MKVIAGTLGALAVVGLIVLAIAGLTGALAILLTAVALVAMIALGGVLGGRHTPNRPPLDRPGSPAGTGDDRAEQADEG